MLALEHVTVGFTNARRARADRLALDDVNMQVHERELVAVRGGRRSGRSTLLHVCAGMMRPTVGSVRFHGQEVSRGQLLGANAGIAYADRDFSPVLGETVLHQVAAPLLANAVRLSDAEARAVRLLQAVGAGECAYESPGDLSHDETIRVAIARAMVTGPRLLLIDEPTNGIGVTGEGPLLELIRSLVDEHGVAVLMTVDHVGGLAGADRAMSISDGVVRGELEPAPPAEVVPFARRRAEPSA
jgi:putative ABC transport system ATP-binding protein